MTEPPDPAASAEEARLPERRRVLSFIDRLSVRFALVVALALLPLGIGALYQTSQLRHEVERRAQEALLGETLQAAASEVGIIQQAQGIAAGLAASLSSSPPSAETGAFCATLMRNANAAIPQATIVMFVPTSGQMTCSSTGKTHEFSGNPLFESVRDNKTPSFVVNRRGPVSGTSVLGVLHPVILTDGTVLGYVSISLPHEGLEAANTPQKSALSGSVEFLTFDRDGEVLTASGGLDLATAYLPRDRLLTDLVGSPSKVFKGLSTAGTARTFAVVPMIDGELYLLSSWDSTKDPGGAIFGPWPYLAPILMWISGLIVAGWASERLVSKHIRVLNRSIARFADGDRRLKQNIVKRAPNELKELGEAFEAMSESITVGEAELEDTIHQKEVLLREVHHRVKNNLQLIASIVNMQMRKASAPETRQILKGLQDRIVSLATVHRGLYQTSGLADVRADELFSDIVRQIIKLATAPENPMQIEKDFDPLVMTPDQTVPLSLFLTEAITNAIKYTGPTTDRPARIEVGLKRLGGDEAVLHVSNPLAQETDLSRDPGIFDDESTNGLGRQLLRAFAQQVGGRLESGVTDGSYWVKLHFAVRELNEAENRKAIAADPDT